MRPASALAAIGCALIVAGCGESRSDSAETTAPVAGSLEELWRAPGEDVAVVAGTSDYGPGRNRVSFLIVDSESRVIERPTARVWVSRGLDQPPFQETTATLEDVGVPGGAQADAPTIYVAEIDLPGPGTYWLLAEPEGGEPIQALGNVVARKAPEAPAVGDPAVSSRTPTIASTGGDLGRLTTASRPDRELYSTSVAEALEAGDPFVVSFATPRFCESRTCGPSVDVLSAVRRKLAGSGVRFIHVEVYEDNDPARGVNRWVKEWRLPTEPWTFVVDADGVIRERFEGAVSARELEAAVRAVTGA